MAHDVFISHSSKDKVMADAICAGLEARGIRCWIAPRDVEPGEEWTRAIVEAITACKVFLLVFTTNSNASSQIVKELDCATSDEKTILPFRIEDIKPTGSMKYYLGSLHWLDAITPPMEKQIDHLADYIGHILGFPARANTEIKDKPETQISNDSASIDKDPLATKIRDKPKKTKTGLLIILGIISVGLIIGVFFLTNGNLLAQLLPQQSPSQTVTPTTTHTLVPPTSTLSLLVENTATSEPFLLIGIGRGDINCRLDTSATGMLVKIIHKDEMVNIMGTDSTHEYFNVEYTTPDGKIDYCWIQNKHLDFPYGLPAQVPTVTPTGLFTTTDAGLTGIITANSNCWESANEGTTNTKILMAGDEVIILGKSADGNWLNIEFVNNTRQTYCNRSTPVTDCWLKIDENIEIGGLTEPLPVFTPRPAALAWWYGEVTCSRANEPFGTWNFDNVDYNELVKELLSAVSQYQKDGLTCTYRTFKSCKN